MGLQAHGLFLADGENRGLAWALWAKKYDGLGGRHAMVELS
mgnify:CR=1 FL=1|jgi:hypothetical protein